MSFLSDDDSEKTLNRFRNTLFFKKLRNSVRDPAECYLDVVSNPQKAYIARIDCVSSPTDCTC